MGWSYNRFKMVARAGKPDTMTAKRSEENSWHGDKESSRSAHTSDASTEPCEKESMPSNF